MPKNHVLLEFSCCWKHDSAEGPRARVPCGARELLGSGQPTARAGAALGDLEINLMESGREAENDNLLFLSDRVWAVRVDNLVAVNVL